jgi:hypothetical protein
MNIARPLCAFNGALLALALAGCQTVGLPPDAKFPGVPREISACAEVANAPIPTKDLSAAEVEKAWKQDRLTAVALRQCLQRLIVRDQKLAKKK